MKDDRTQSLSYRETRLRDLEGAWRTRSKKTTSN